jgi:hypothetical protein
MESSPKLKEKTCRLDSLSTTTKEARANTSKDKLSNVLSLMLIPSKRLPTSVKKLSKSLTKKSRLEDHARQLLS